MEHALSGFRPESVLFGIRLEKLPVTDNDSGFHVYFEFILIP